MKLQTRKHWWLLYEETSYWDHYEPEYKYYELMGYELRGIFTFVERVRYYTTNASLINLRIDKESVKACGQKIFGIDL